MGVTYCILLQKLSGRNFKRPILFQTYMLANAIKKTSAICMCFMCCQLVKNDTTGKKNQETITIGAETEGWEPGAGIEVIVGRTLPTLQLEDTEEKRRVGFRRRQYSPDGQ